MAVLDTAIHENTEPGGEAWIAGSSPAMTTKGCLYQRCCYPISSTGQP